MAVTRSRRRTLPSLWQSPDPALTTALLQYLSTSNWFGVKTGAHLDGLLLVGQMACLSVAWHEAADDWRRDYSAKEQTIACSSSSILGFLTRHHHRDLANALDNALSIDWHPSRFTEQLPRISGIRVLLFESNSCPPRNITSGEVTRFLARYSQLEKVEIDFANALDNDLLVALGKHCSQLRELSLVEGEVDNMSFDDRGLIALARGCPKLEALYLCAAPGVTDLGLAVLSHRCPALRELDLSGSEVTDDGIIELIYACSRLALLNLHGTDSITDKTLHYLVEAGVCPELAELGLMANPEVTVAAVDALRLSRRITIVR